MTQEAPGSRAADLAANRVEAIVAAAEATAAQLEQAARRQADEIREQGRADAQREIDAARKEAIQLGVEARRSAERTIEEAEKASQEARERARRELEERVGAADEAAAQVLAEARALSGGLRQLGATLQDQGERILREVQGAHKRMQADLRVAWGDGDRPPPSRPAGAEPARRRGNPFAEIDVPEWEERER